MAVKSITLLEETNAYDSINNDYYGEPMQGSTYDLVRIYVVESDDGSQQYFKHTTTLGSYGYAYAGDIASAFTEVKPREKTVTVFE